MKVVAGILGLAVLVIGAASARAEAPRPHPPERAGVLVAVTTATTTADDRPRAIAGAFVAKGLESFVAHEMAWPPSDADRRIIRGRWRLDDARRLRRRRRFVEASRAAADAVDLFASSATERAHLDLLVSALVERGTNAALLEDPATAETVFLEALALDPRHEPDPELYPQDARRLFADVRRAARQLRFATLVVDAPALPGAEVEVDFTGSRPPPYSTKLSEGRHFVSVIAPGRHPVIVPVTVRAERQHRVELFPPLAGDSRAREAALRNLEPAEPATVVELARSAGLRFVLAVRASPSQVELALYDGRTGQPVSSGQVTLSGQPAPPEIAAAADRIMQAILLHDPDSLDLDAGASWYSTWWGITIIGVVVAGAAAGTAVALTAGRDTEYRFEP